MINSNNGNIDDIDDINCEDFQRTLTEMLDLVCDNQRESISCLSGQGTQNGAEIRWRTCVWSLSFILSLMIRTAPPNEVMASILSMSAEVTKSILRASSIPEQTNIN